LARGNLADDREVVKKAFVSKGRLGWGKQISSRRGTNQGQREVGRVGVTQDEEAVLLKVEIKYVAARSTGRPYLRKPTEAGAGAAKSTRTIRHLVRVGGRRTGRDHPYNLKLGHIQRNPIVKTRQTDDGGTFFCKGTPIKCAEKVYFGEAVREKDIAGMFGWTSFPLSRREKEHQWGLRAQGEKNRKLHRN